MSLSNALLGPMDCAATLSKDESAIKTLIIHRDPLVADSIRNVLGLLSGYEVVADCVSGSEAVEAIARHNPQVILLDLQVPKVEMLGTQNLRKLNPLILFFVAPQSHLSTRLTKKESEFVLTKFGEEEGLRLAAEANRLFSVSARRKSQQVLRLFLGKPKNSRAGRFAFKSGRDLVVLDLNEIVSIESSENHSRVHTLVASYESRHSLASLAAGLNPKLFYRVSASAVVNVNFIRELSCAWGMEKFAVLQDGRQLRVTKAYGDHLKKIIDASWGSR